MITLYINFIHALNSHNYRDSARIEPLLEPELVLQILFQIEVYWVYEIYYFAERSRHGKFREREHLYIITSMQGSYN